MYYKIIIHSYSASIEMHLFSTLSDFYNNNPVIAIIIVIACFTLITLMVLLIVCFVKRRKTNLILQNGKNKNTI